MRRGLLPMICGHGIYGGELSVAITLRWLYDSGLVDTINEFMSPVSGDDSEGWSVHSVSQRSCRSGVCNAGGT